MRPCIVGMIKFGSNTSILIFVMLFYAIFLFVLITNYLNMLFPSFSEHEVILHYGPQSNTVEEICKKILEITSSEQESKIIVNERNGGLGHKSISTVEEIIYALLSRKQLWC